LNNFEKVYYAGLIGITFDALFFENISNYLFMILIDQWSKPKDGNLSRASFSLNEIGAYIF